MTMDLKVSVRREIDRLTRDLAAARGRVAELQNEIKRHELIYGMLDGRKTGKQSPAGSFYGWSAEAGAARRDDRLERGLSDSARRVYSGYSERPRDGERETATLPQAVGRTLVEGGSDQAHPPGHVPENLIPKKLDVRALGDVVLVLKPLAIRLR